MLSADLALPAVALSVVGLSVAALVGSASVRTGARRVVVDYGVFAVFGFFALVGIWLFFNRDSAFFRELLARYWLVALFAIFILEGAMLLYFAPSESLIPIAVGMTLHTDVAEASVTTWALIVGTSVVGATIGQYLLFSLAKRWGRERLLAKPWFRVSEETLDRFDVWFERWGILAIPGSNTLLFTRGMLTVPAGLSEMGSRRFVVLSALGTLSFETILALGTIGVLEFVPLPALSVVLSVLGL